MARVECGAEYKVCERVPKPEGHNGVALIYMTKDGIYGYHGEFTQQAFLNWLSADNYKEDPPLEEDMD